MWHSFRGFWVLVFLVASSRVLARTIDYEVTNLSGNTWSYSYMINNDLGFDIEEFTIFFDYTLYENLAVGTTPADWNPFVAQSDTFLPDDGYYDALALSSGISDGDSLGIFSVTFDWLGGGTPGSQPFDIIDPNTFNTLHSGDTSSASVPAPGALFLFGMGILSLWGSRRIVF